jgi:NitT/TauT family transport system substrate-binding protein
MAAAAAASLPSSARAGASPLRLGWPARAVALVAVQAAVELGLFAQYGLDIEFVEGTPGGGDLAAMLRAGRVDAVAAPVSLLLDPIRQGLDATFTTGISGGGVRLLSEKRSGLRHIEDMKHHRIGVADPAGPSRLFFSIMMRRKGIDPFHEVQWVTVPAAEQEDALRQRRVDAVGASDPQAFYLLRALNAVEIASNLSGSYDQRVANGLACGAALMRDRRGEAASLTRAIRQGAAWASTHTAQAALMVAPWTPRLTPADRQAMLRSENLREDPDGNALVDDIAAYVDELRLLGTFPFELNAERFARGICADLA